MATLDPKFLRELVARTLPNLRFSDLERWFPVRAESWLTHATSAPWSPDADDVASLAVDRNFRGTALFETDDAMTNLAERKVAGPPNDDDAPLRLVEENAPDAVGNPAYRKRSRDTDLFAAFAGWTDPQRPQLGGDLEYLYDAFSELASALDHRLAWKPLAQRPNRPYFGHPQPASPATYCEADWAGVHPRLQLGDFAVGAEQELDDYLQLTYYYLFPARAPLAEQPGTRPLEGQWAAISLFYRNDGERPLVGEDGRPRNIDIDPKAMPEWVVFSLDPSDGTPTSTVLPFGRGETEILAWPGIAAHVAAYVGAGSHRLFRERNADAVVVDPPRWPELTYEPGGDWEGLSVAVIPALVGALGAGVAAGVAAGLAGVGAAGAVAIGLGVAVAAAVVLLIVLILLWLLFMLLSELWDDDADTTDIPPSKDPPISGGPSAGDPTYGPAAPAGGDQAPPGSAGSTGDGPGGGSKGDPTGWWPTNEGSTRGWDVGYFDVMTVSRFSELVQKDPTLAPPAWWDFAGRWGIKVPNTVDRAWEPGTRRTDGHGRSWAYWHAHALVNHLVMTTPTPGP